MVKDRLQVASNYNDYVTGTGFGGAASWHRKGPVFLPASPGLLQIIN